ncbi:LamG domain-containing protein [Rubellimicrobium rubrum]|nr:LamG domain-containing protein [Rubellimicrobium rubrum]
MNNQANAELPDAILRHHWSWDSGLCGPAQDWATWTSDQVGGVQEFVPGVGGGLALRFDGFTTWLERPSGPALSSGSFTVTAWVAPGAWPWNLAPLVDMAPGQGEGFHLSLDSTGRAVFAVALDGAMVTLRTPEPLALSVWSHLAGTYEADRGLRLLLDGVVVAEIAHAGAFHPAPDGSVVIGRSRTPLKGTGSTRPASHLAIPNYLDALLDEVTIWDGARRDDVVAQEVAVAARPVPKLPARKLPVGPGGRGTFGAFYTRLEYYDAWDRRWRVGDHPDVVVRFDDEDFRFVFWRGTNYIPCWVSAEGIWYTNEFNETWGNGATGCAEPMSDKHCAYSHVRIIESNEARCVIHWRYALVDVMGVRPRKDPVTGWTDFSDEIYTIYPDGTGTRAVTLHSSQPLEAHEFQESILVLGPGQTPHDVIGPDALTMANMAGEEHTYSWADGPPPVIDKPDRCNIQLTNIRSDTRPFVVVPDGPCLTRDLRRSDRPVFPPYTAEIQPGQLLPWWNHWPTSELPSDGRWAEGADRASHASLVSGLEWADHAVTPTSRTRVHLHGLTRNRARDLVPMARSWLNPPLLDVQTPGVTSRRYEALERAYVLDCGDGIAELSLRVEASRGSPLVNLALVVRNWRGSQSPSVWMDGNAVPPGADCRIALRETLSSRDLLLWLRIRSEVPVALVLGSASNA